MASALRLPPHLDALARAYADEMGISVNALVCVLLHAHSKANPLPGGGPAPSVATRAGSPSKPSSRGKLKQLELDVGKPPADPKPARKVSAKKESYKDRQRARDTAFKAVKA